MDGTGSARSYTVSDVVDPSAVAGHFQYCYPIQCTSFSYSTVEYLHFFQNTTFNGCHIPPESPMHYCTYADYTQTREITDDGADQQEYDGMVSVILST